MRNTYVDYLRGASILLVLAVHFAIIPEAFPGNAFLSKIVGGGYYGVTMFFVISGYLITSRTLVHYGTLGTVSLREFYAMRTARIGPCLLLSIALLAALNAGKVSEFTTNDIGRHIFYAITFRFNLYRVNYGYGVLAWDVLWSLSVEEVFYLIFPVMCRLYKNTSYLCIMLIIVIINGLIYRNNYYVDNGTYDGLFMYLGCFDAIAFGCLTAVLAARHPIQNSRGAAGVAIFGFIFAFACIAHFPIDTRFVVGPTCVAFGAAAYLFGVHGRKSPAGLPRPLGTVLALLSACGILSYELYLYHGFVVTLVLGLFERSAFKAHWPKTAAIGYTALFTFITVAVSLAIHRYYAEPLGRSLRRRLGAGKVLEPRSGTGDGLVTGEKLG